MQTESLTHWYGVCERTALGPACRAAQRAFLVGVYVVAVAIFRQYRRHEDLENKWKWDVHVLTVLTFIIGVNSVAFHAFPNPTTELADTLTIVLFIVLYFWCVLFRIGRTTIFQAGVCFYRFCRFSHILVHQFPRALNDSIGYLSSMIALIMIAVYLFLKARPSSTHFMLAAIVGVVSLFCRRLTANYAACCLPVRTSCGIC
jgi:hypothetical protein